MQAPLSAAERHQVWRDALLGLGAAARVDPLRYAWSRGHTPRPNQLPPPGNWTTWLILTGRGWGKSRTGAEWVRAQVESGTARRVALVAPTAADVRDVMVEGESGLLAVCETNRPLYQPSIRRLTWPNGAMATTYSGDEPERLRGPQHDAAWIDELGAFRYAEEAWTMLNMGLRLGRHPRILVTTTPKPSTLLRQLVRRAERGTDVVYVRGTSYENREHLPATFFDQIVSVYEGTRIGRQELYAELLEEAEGALWKREWFDAHRVMAVPGLRRITVNIDPAASHTQDSDETGLIVTAEGADGHGYVLADASGRYTPDGWARKAIELYTEHRANLIVAERNNGGDMVTHTIRTTAAAMGATVAVRTVWASQGKIARAEPVAALYEQGRVHHAGTFAALEDQCCSWNPRGAERSPDRLDAMVWGFTALLLTRPPGKLKVVGY